MRFCEGVVRVPLFATQEPGVEYVVAVFASIRFACPCEEFGKGQMESALIGSLQISCFLTEGLFGYSRETNYIFPKVPGRTFSPNLSTFLTFAAAPVVKPAGQPRRVAICRQPRIPASVSARSRRRSAPRTTSGRSLGKSSAEP